MTESIENLLSMAQERGKPVVAIRATLSMRADRDPLSCRRLQWPRRLYPQVFPTIRGRKPCVCIDIGMSDHTVDPIYYLDLAFAGINVN